MNILQAIEDARQKGILSNDVARAMSVIHEMTGDEALLACRLIQGPDPASIEYLLTGKISEHIMMAHREGPGSLHGHKRGDWLDLASYSVDESKLHSLRDNILAFSSAIEEIMKNGRGCSERIAEKEAEIKSLPYEMRSINGREVRVYDADLGFAAAYWDGEPCAVVKGDGFMMLGSNGTPLKDLGFTISNKESRGPCFAIIL